MSSPSNESLTATTTTTSTASAANPPDPVGANLPEANDAERVRSRAIAWGAGAFLAFGVGIPIAYALHDWRLGLVVGVVIGLLTVVGYLKAGADHAERRADRLADQYSRKDIEDEDDDGSYS